MLNQFKNLSCYEEFEILCTLNGISKVDILKKIGHWINNHYFFISDDGIFNWFDLEGNHVEDPGILKELKSKYIPSAIIKCNIPNSVIRIGYDAFFNCESLISITIPDGVTHIDNHAFFNCKSLKSITIPNSVTYIGNGAFCNCKSLTSITIPDSVISIGYGAFCYCTYLKNVDIPDNVIRIDSDAFWHCESLETITIPDSVTTIGIGVFYNCTSLKEIVFKGKTLEEVKQMKNYPFEIKDKSIIKCEM